MTLGGFAVVRFGLSLGTACNACHTLAITFPTPTADWGTAPLIWTAIYDASTSGNIIAAAPLNRPVRVVNGDEAPVFLPGALQFQL